MPFIHYPQVIQPLYVLSVLPSSKFNLLKIKILKKGASSQRNSGAANSHFFVQPTRQKSLVFLFAEK